MSRLVFILCCLLTGPAFSQQIGIRSGAHDSFARLVLDAPPGINWTLKQSLTGVELTLEGHQDGFNTSTIFDKIDRTYISSVSGDRSSIFVEFACECGAEAFNEGSSMIVLDVSNAEESPDKDVDGRALDFVGNRELRFEKEKSDGIVDEVESKNDSMAPVSVVPRIEPLDSAIQMLPNHPETPSANAGRLSDARDRITRQIGTAATRGILDPVRDSSKPSIGYPKPQIDTGIFGPASDDVALTSLGSEATSNVRISNSNTLPPDLQRTVSASISDGFSCIDPQRIDVTSWGSEDTLSQQVSQLRGQLYGEFDELEADVALELARTYLYFGFGAEARQILLLDRDVKAGNPELLSMAAILEYGHSPDSKYLSRFLECDSEAALWAILSLQNIDPTTSLNIDAALLSASALPMHLRGILVPELSRRLLAYGDADSASAALRSLERAPEDLNSNASLAKADLELADKNTEQAQERLSEIVTSNSEQSAKALIRFVDSHLAADSEIDENVATLVEAYAQEMRDDPLEAELRRTHVLALGKSGQFSAAFDALHRMRARKTEAGQDTLRSSVLDLLVRNSDDIEFLEHAFDQIDIAPESLTPKARFQLAQRLAKLGFSQQAQIVLESGVGYTDQETVALLRAEISLSLERPLEALAHLFGVNSEAASRLRAQAEANSGGFSQAHQIYSELENTAQMQSVAWLSGDWLDRVGDEAPVFGPMVSVAQNALEDQAGREGMLERTADFISESQNARSAIQQLLNSDELISPESE